MLWKIDRSKEVVHMQYNLTGQDTYSDAGQTINDDFPALSTNCEKPIVW